MTLARPSLLLFALALASCGAEHPSSGWVQVSEHTGCEALSPQFCVGAFGFTVKSDGGFTVGPASNGQTLTGTVTAGERARIAADAEAAAQSVTAAASCDRTALVPGVTDQVNLVDARGGTVPVYQINPGAICYRARREAALALHADVAALMARYYPRPFPPG